MARSLNKVILIGNVGNEPEIRTVGSGTKLAKISLATNRTFSDRSGQKQEKTEWHRLTFWDKLAEVVERYVKKGDRIYVEGRLEYSTTKDDKGQERYWTDVVINEMIMLGGQAGGGGGGGGADYDQGREADSRGGRRPGSGQQQASSPFETEDDDLPF
jgi:single-strand DNA-binding protein